MYPYPTNSSSKKTASAQISTLPGFLAGIDMLAPSTGIATLTIYDSTNGANGIILAEMEVDAGQASCNHEYVNFVVANRGIYANLNDSTNSSSFIIRYAVTG